MPATHKGVIRPYGATDVVDPQYLRKRGIFVGASHDRDAQLTVSAYKQLRTHVLTELDVLSARSLLVTGPTAGVGKTTVSLNLAINIANLPDRKVILVDLDLRASSMQTVLGITKDYGTERIADTDFSIHRAASSVGIHGLIILTCAARTQDSSELLLSPVTRSFLERLRNLPKEYLVIYDSPPILGCDDVSAILPSMEAALMVVEQGATSKRELSEAMSRIESLPVVSTVLNKSRDSDIRKYYY